MILDWLQNAHSYLPLNPRFAKAFEFLQHPELKGLPEEKYEIDGDKIFAIFFPEDAHMPLISSRVLHKIVVKVKVD